MMWLDPDRDDNWSRRLGPERCEPGRAFPIRSLRESGALVALGSDWPVARYDPRIGLAAARLRRPPGERDRRPYDDEALDGLAALEGYTTGAAATIGEERRLGRIAARLRRRPDRLRRGPGRVRLPTTCRSCRCCSRWWTARSSTAPDV